MRRLYSHADMRVRDRARATTFYDAIFAPFGMVAEAGENFTCYTIEPEAPQGDEEWFGFTEDATMRPGTGRLSFRAASRDLVDRVAAAARSAGAGAIEGPAVCSEYSDNYYAVFFDDPDGNKLEVCCLAE